jgi:glycosyltransferase involved in cell wall biosynthesis
LIADLGAQSTVRLLGRVSTEDLVGLYHLATALIFPSLHESWSIPIMEAMACGCPVACSNVTSLPEEIGDAGLIFPPENHDLMVDAINRLSSDENLRRQLAARGKQRVKLFNRAAFTRIIASAYHHAIANHRARKAA